MYLKHKLKGYSNGARVPESSEREREREREWEREREREARFTEPFHSIVQNTHKRFIFRHCINIVFYPAEKSN
jgi:vesicle coat complex subunit